MIMRENSTFEERTDLISLSFHYELFKYPSANLSIPTIATAITGTTTVVRWL